MFKAQRLRVRRPFRNAPFGNFYLYLRFLAFQSPNLFTIDVLEAMVLTQADRPVFITDPERELFNGIDESRKLWEHLKPKLRGKMEQVSRRLMFNYLNARSDIC